MDGRQAFGRVQAGFGRLDIGWRQGFGMGARSQRYSMIVEDGVVKELNIEAPGEFKVSAADYMLAQL